MRDEYPSTDQNQGVHLTVRYPDAAHELSRWLPFVKWLLAVPHYLVLAALTVASAVAVVVSWFAVVITHDRCSTSLWAFCAGTTA